jgi:hypothetical protein
LCNQILNDYQDRLFGSEEKSQLVALEKTQAQGGDLYSEVRYEDRVVSYPNPFLFQVRPLPDHPASNPRKLGRVLCLYDNAGESFQPGRDNVDSPATRHMARSRALFFLFDPTQDLRFRELCKQHSQDPQLGRAQRSERQDSILQEAANRIRRLTGLPEYEKHKRPLVVVVTKYDVWHPILSPRILPKPFRKSNGGGYYLDLAFLNEVSNAVRRILWKYTPEFVSTAESFANEVHYFPVSAMGCSPELDNDTGMLGVRGENLNPIWSEVPMLFALSKFTRIGMPGEPDEK